MGLSPEGTRVDCVVLLLIKHSVQAPSAFISFVGSEKSKNILLFRSLNRTLGTDVPKVLMLDNAQINLAFSSLNRTFVA